MGRIFGMSMFCSSSIWVIISGFLARTSAIKINLDTFQFQNPSAPVISNDQFQSANFNITLGIGQTNARLRFVLEENIELSLLHTSIQYLDSNGLSYEANQMPSSYPLMARGSVLIQDSLDQTWADTGWARIAVIEQKQKPLFDGVFTIGSVTYEIHLESSNEEPTRMVAHQTKQGNSLADPPSRLSTCASPSHNAMQGKRQEWNAWGNDLTQSIGSTDGCPRTRQTAYIGVATDCAYTASFNSTNDAHRHILNVINTASVVFENSFNVSIGIQNLTISDAECPSSVSGTTAWNAACSEGDLNWRLQSFSSWRSSINDNNAYWTLFSGCPSSSGEVGVSWIGALCNSESGYSSSGAGTNVVARTQLEWQVFAHESAHTFGAVHDCTAATCGTQPGQCCPLSADTCDAGGQYIMDPTSRPGVTRFSPCTIGTVCSRLGSGRVDSRCLVDAGSGNNTGSNGRCGNGILEPGEACDCGNGACNERDTTCCDSVTCQWREGGQCDRSTTRPGSGDNGGPDNGDSGYSWVHDHSRLIIGIAAGVGGALVLLIFGWIVIGCRQRKPTLEGDREGRKTEQTLSR